MTYLKFMLGNVLVVFLSMSCFAQTVFPALDQQELKILLRDVDLVIVTKVVSVELVKTVGQDWGYAQHWKAQVRVTKILRGDTEKKFEVFFVLHPDTQTLEAKLQKGQKVILILNRSRNLDDPIYLFDLRQVQNISNRKQIKEILR